MSDIMYNAGFETNENKTIKDKKEQHVYSVFNIT